MLYSKTHWAAYERTRVGNNSFDQVVCRWTQISILLPGYKTIEVSRVTVWLHLLLPLHFWEGWPREGTAESREGEGSRAEDLIMGLLAVPWGHAKGIVSVRYPFSPPSTSSNLSLLPLTDISIKQGPRCYYFSQDIALSIVFLSSTHTSANCPL